MGNKIAIFLAVVLGVMAVVLVNNHLKKAKETFIGDTIDLVIAIQKIEAGEEFKTEKMGATRVPLRFINSSKAFLPWKDRGLLLGGKSRYLVEPGEWLHMRIVDREEETDGEAIVITTGRRGYTIPASPASAVAGLLVIGDRIDIMGSFRILGEEQGLSGMRTEKTRTMFLMEDIVIKALDKKVRGKVDNFSSMTFELYPVECLVLEYAQTTGKITIVKRDSQDIMTQVPREEDYFFVTRETLETFIKNARNARVTANLKDYQGGR
jgi:Flp pilus assembly protein CpaB